MINGRSPGLSLQDQLIEWGQSPFPDERLSTETTDLDRLVRLFEGQPAIAETGVRPSSRYLLWSVLSKSVNHLLVAAYRTGVQSLKDRRCVLKFDLRDFQVLSDEDRDRQSARVTRLINNLPGELQESPEYRVIRYNHWGWLDTYRYLEMEYIEGRNLKQLQQECANGRMPYMDACRWVARAARAIDAYHQLGLYHFDIKPSNLMVDANGCLVVIDVDSVRRDDEHAQGPDVTVTQAGQMTTTLAYAAPECREGFYDRKSDQYSLGVTLYHLIGNEFPYSTLRGASSLKPLADVPVVLWNIIRKMLAINPRNRFESLDEVASQLECLSTLQGRVWTSYRQKLGVQHGELVDLHASLEEQDRCRTAVARKRNKTMGIWSASGSGASHLIDAVYRQLGIKPPLGSPIRVTVRAVASPKVRVWTTKATERKAILAAAYQFRSMSFDRLDPLPVQKLCEGYARDASSANGKLEQSSFEVGMQLAEVVGLLHGRDLPVAAPLDKTQMCCLKTAECLPAETAAQFSNQVLWDNDPEFVSLSTRADSVQDGQAYSLQKFRKLYKSQWDGVAKNLFISEIEVAFPESQLDQLLGGHLGKVLRRIDLLLMPAIPAAVSARSVEHALHLGHARLAGILHARRHSFDQLVLVCNLEQDIDAFILRHMRQAIQYTSVRADHFLPVLLLCNAWPFLVEFAGIVANNPAQSRHWAIARDRFAAVGTDVNRVHISELRSKIVHNLQPEMRAQTRNRLRGLSRQEEIPEKLQEMIAAVLDNEPLEVLWYYLPGLLYQHSPTVRLEDILQQISARLEGIDRKSFTRTDHGNRAALMDWAERLKQIARFGQIRTEHQWEAPERQPEPDNGAPPRRYERAQAAIDALLDLTHLTFGQQLRWPVLSPDRDRRQAEAEQFIDSILKQLTDNSIDRTRLHHSSLGYADPDEFAEVWMAYLNQTVLLTNTRRELSEFFKEIASGGNAEGVRRLMVKVQNCLMPKYRSEKHDDYCGNRDSNIYAVTSSRIRVILSFIRSIEHAAMQ